VTSSTNINVVYYIINTTANGTGYLNPSNLHFQISGFEFDGDFVEDANTPTSATGNLGPNTVLTGSFMGPADFGVSGTGQLIPEYDIASGTNYGLPAYIDFYGGLETRPLLEVEGHFDFGFPVNAVSYSYFGFVVNMNSNMIYDAGLSVGFQEASSNEAFINFVKGSGTLSGNTFNVSFPSSMQTYIVSGTPNSTPATATFSGTFDSASPDIGSQVVPGSGGLSITYGSTPPPGAPTGVGITISDGTMKKAGS
jgi:hypothetical protein